MTTYQASLTHSAPICLKTLAEYRERKHQRDIKAAQTSGLVRLWLAVTGMAGK